MARPEPGIMITPSVRLVREIAGGGMGRVWLADHTTLHTTVVVKFLSPEYAEDDDARERFSREASAAAQVRSPHVVQMFDHGITADGIPYIVMEHLEGRDLRGVLHATTRLAVKDIVPIIVQIAKALSRAHKRGVVHRDIKPENIFLCDHGDDILVKLLDFGIAKATHSGTATGTVIGTPPYMSPEQLLGKKLDVRTDLWSLGVVAYEALTGTMPFKGETVGMVTLSVFNEGARPPSQAYPELGTAFDDWFARACALEADDRFGSASEMADGFIVAAGGRVSRTPPLVVEASGPVSAAPAPSIATNMPTIRNSPASERSNIALIALTVLFVFGIAFAVLLYRTRTVTPAPAASAPLPTATQVASVAPEPTPSATVAAVPSSSASASTTSKPKPTKGVTLPSAKKAGKHDAPIF
jgi:eukaryotic-like serine/threonine-protein kinase